MVVVDKLIFRSLKSSQKLVSQSCSILPFIENVRERAQLKTASNHRDNKVSDKGARQVYLSSGAREEACLIPHEPKK